MDVTISEGALAAAECFEEAVKLEYIYALCLYQTQGIEPSSDKPYYPCFVAEKVNIDKKTSKTTQAKKAAKARWEKKQEQDEAENNAHLMQENAEIEAHEPAYAEKNQHNGAYAEKNQHKPAYAKENKEEEKEKRTKKEKEEETKEILTHTRKENPLKGVKEKKSPRFIAPSADDVGAYARERGAPYFDSQRFCDYYQAQGWKLSNGIPMKDWKAAVRNWLSRNNQKKEVVNEFAKYR